MAIEIRLATIEDYDALIELWNTTEMSRRALNPVDDSREGIQRYLERNPETCFVAVEMAQGSFAMGQGVCSGRIVGVVLSGHDGRRGIIHHMNVHPEFRRRGIASALVERAEAALKRQGVNKILIVVFSDNKDGNSFWQSRGYSLRTNLCYRNKSLCKQIPQGE